MESCLNTETLNRERENTVEAGTNNYTNNFQEMQEETSTNPISNAGNTSNTNSNTLYDSLPINDTVIGNLDMLSENFNDCTAIQEKQNNRGNHQKEAKKLNENVQVGNALSQIVLDYGLSDTDDSNSDSDGSLSDSDSNEDNNSSKPNNVADETLRNNSEFRENASSSDSTSEYESDSSTSFSDIGACGVTLAPVEKKRTPEKMTAPRTKGEISLEELPPIEELKISVPEDECIEIGVVTSIIDQLVIVQSLRGTPAYDIDTLFFLNRGSRPLGRVFDVLGPVTEPLYAIRFNSYEQAIETGAKPGTPVYCAPRTQHTSYVFVSELMKIKGSDASWEHNNEPPDVFLDYSDDEQERQARRQVRKKPPTDVNKSNSLERNKKFEKQMNDKNLLMNERYKNQQSSAVRNKKKPETRAPMMGAAAVGPPPPWVVHNPAAPIARPQFWSPPYQFAAYPPYGPLPLFPQLDVTPRQHFVPPMMGPSVFHPAPQFNPSIPPPIMRPQPVSYFPKPRHPPWVPPAMNLGVGVLQPPRGNFGNGSSYTQ